jgi:hypothetical protein
MSVSSSYFNSLVDSSEVSLEVEGPKPTTNMVLTFTDMSVDIKPVNHACGIKVTSSPQGNIKSSNKIISTFPRSTTVTDSSGNELSTIDIIEEKLSISTRMGLLESPCECGIEPTSCPVFRCDSYFNMINKLALLMGNSLPFALY